MGAGPKAGLGQRQHGNMFPQHGRFNRPDGVRSTRSIDPVHLQQVGWHTGARQALGQRALQGKNDQRQLLCGMAHQHQVEFKVVIGIQYPGARRGGLQHVGVGDLAEVLQRVAAFGWWWGFKNAGVGAGLNQGTAGAAWLARHAGHIAQGRAKLAAQQRAGVVGQGQGLLHAGDEAVAGDGQGVDVHWQSDSGL